MLVLKNNVVFALGAMGLALLFCLPIQIIPTEILSLFIKDSQLVTQGITDFRMMFVVFPFYGFMIIAISFFQSVGKGSKASIMVIMRQVALFIPLAYLLPIFFDTSGIWLAMPISDGVVTLLAFTLIITEQKKMKSVSLKVSQTNDKNTSSC